MNLRRPGPAAAPAVVSGGSGGSRESGGEFQIIKHILDYNVFFKLRHPRNIRIIEKHKELHLSPHVFEK